MASRQFGGDHDPIDAKLISLLVVDARMSLTALARELDLSRTAVRARMTKLERGRVIVGYRAVLGGVLGTTPRNASGEDEGIGAILSITFSQRPCSPVVETFRHWPEIASYYSVTGAYDAFVMVKVGTTQDLANLVDRLSAIDGVGTVRSAVVLKSDPG